MNKIPKIPYNRPVKMSQEKIDHVRITANSLILIYKKEHKYQRNDHFDRLTLGTIRHLFSKVLISQERNIKKDYTLNQIYLMICPILKEKYSF